MFIDDLGMRHIDREKGGLPISCIAHERTAKKKTGNEQTILAQSRFPPAISQ